MPATKSGLRLLPQGGTQIRFVDLAIHCGGEHVHCGLVITS